MGDSDARPSFLLRSFLAQLRPLFVVLGIPAVRDRFAQVVSSVPSVALDQILLQEFRVGCLLGFINFLLFYCICNGFLFGIKDSFGVEVERFRVIFYFLATGKFLEGSAGNGKFFGSGKSYVIYDMSAWTLKSLAAIIAFD